MEPQYILVMVWLGRFDTSVSCYDNTDAAFAAYRDATTNYNTVRGVTLAKRTGLCSTERLFAWENPTWVEA